MPVSGTKQDLIGFLVKHQAMVDSLKMKPKASSKVTKKATAKAPLVPKGALPNTGGNAAQNVINNIIYVNTAPTEIAPPKKSTKKSSKKATGTHVWSHNK